MAIKLLKRGSSDRKHSLQPSVRRSKRRKLSLQSLESRRLLAVYLVDSFLDSATGFCAPGGTGNDGCSLRSAIIAANSNPGPDSITLPAGTYDLSLPQLPGDDDSGGDLSITDDLTITGSPADPTLTVIDANELGRVFSVFRVSVNAPALTVNFNGLTIQGGAAPLGSSGGGGIGSGSNTTLNVSDSIIRGNRAVEGGDADGGGISASGNLVLNNTAVISNVAEDFGGGVAVSADSTVTITGSTITDNTSGNHGGGLWAGNRANYQIAISNTSIENNQSTSGDGGGLYVEGDTTAATVDLDQVLIRSNQAAFAGGGALVSMVASLTQAGGTYDQNSSGDAGGGLLVLDNGSVTVDGTTFTGNTALSGGGGAAVYTAATFRNTLFQQNSVTGSPLPGVIRFDLGGGGIAAAQQSSVRPLLRIEDSSILQNTAALAAGIGSANSFVEIINSTVDGNQAIGNVGGGGGIGFAQDDVSGDPAARVRLTITNSTISNNVSDSEAGGIGIADADATITDATITGNTATGGRGGGIGLIGFANSPTMQLNRVTIDNNTAGSDGGGIAVQDAGFSMVNTTLSDNAAGNNGGGLAYGNSNPALAGSVEFSTIASNNSGQFGSNVAVSSSVTRFLSTIIADAQGTAPALNFVSGGPGQLVSRGNNLVSDLSSSFAAAGDQVNVDPLLGPLADNGGAVRTRALLTASPAIDAGATTTLAVDARGTARPIDGDGDSVAVNDVGAVEAPMGLAQTFTLGDLVFRDIDNNGTFEAATETGISNVTLELFRDTNSSGDFDSNDVLIGSTVTDSNGSYQFANLSAGDYVIRIPGSNFFGPAGALSGMVTSSGNDPAPDPNDNIDNDDNGIPFGFSEVVSQAITLSSTAGVTNLTLDFGFITSSLELRLNPRTADDEAFGAEFNPATRTLTVEVDEIFNLEVNYLDLRNRFGGDFGAFAIYTNIVSNLPNLVMPVLTETQIISISGNVRGASSGDLLFSLADAPGTTVRLDITTFATNPAEGIKTALAGLGFDSSQLSVVEVPNAGLPTDPLVFQIRFLDFDLEGVDIPSLVVTSSLDDGNGQPIEVTSTNNSIPVRNPDGSINPVAVGFNLNVLSRTFGNNLPFFGFASSSVGTFDPDRGFIGVGASGPIAIGGVASLGEGPLIEPFDAFSIPVRVTAPVNNLQLTLTPTGDPRTQNVLYLSEPAVRDDTILINLANDPAVATDGFGLLNIIATATPTNHVLSTGTGDGDVTIEVDSLGAFGSNVNLSREAGAVYDPLGPVTASTTVFDSRVGLRSSAGPFEPLQTANPNAAIQVPISGDLQTASSQFSIGPYSVSLIQSVVPNVSSAGARLGAQLTQTYVITNTSGISQDLDLVRYLDADLMFDSSLDDGGGVLLDAAGNIVLFETDKGGVGSTDTTFVGIANSGGDVLSSNRFEIDEFSRLRSKLFSGPTATLADTVFNDSDADGFVDAGSEYDVELALASRFSLAPGSAATFTTRTLFGTRPTSVAPPSSTTLTGQVSCDANGNGLLDPNEASSGVSVFIDENGNRRRDNGEVGTTTDSTGTYSFSGLNIAAGQTATVVVQNPPACAPMAPDIGVTRSLLTTGALSRGIVAADINNDGHQELLVVNELGNDVSVLVNNGETGGFSQGNAISVGKRPVAIASWEPGGSSSPVIAVAAVGTSANRGSIYVIENGQLSRELSAGDGPVSVAINDFNGDGQADFVAATLRSGTIVGRMSGETGERVLAHARSPKSITAGLLNNDSFVDLVVVAYGYEGDESSDVIVLLGDGQGNFTPQPQQISGRGSVDVEVANFDGDSADEIVVASYDGSVRIFDLNSSVLTPIASVSTQTGVESVAAEDVNGDGRTDLVIANSKAETIELFINQATGFVRNRTISGVPSPSDLVVANLDGDNVLDIAVSNLYGTTRPNYRLPSSATVLGLTVTDREITFTSNQSVQDFTFRGTPLTPQVAAAWAARGFDVDYSGSVSARDALVVINSLSRQHRGEGEETSSKPRYKLDVNQDGQVTALDALLVINHLSRAQRQEIVSGDLLSAPAEGESLRRQQAVDALMSDIGELF